MKRLIRDCDVELAEMDQIEAYREDEQRGVQIEHRKNGGPAGHEWLSEKVYEPKRRRTVELVTKAVDALTRGGKPVSLATISVMTRQIDREGHGVSESGILNNPESRAYYQSKRTWKGKRGPRKSPSQLLDEPTTAHIDPERDAQRVLQRYMRRSKRELAQRLFDTKQAYANAESRWLRAQDRLLTLELQLRQGTK
jgi:hypothetical protein